MRNNSTYLVGVNRFQYVWSSSTGEGYRNLSSSGVSLQDNWQR